MGCDLARPAKTSPVLCSFMANFCCSIELEPRTLKQGQLNHAREVAVGIIQKKETNEVSNIFVEGLKPVAAVKEMAILMVQETNKLEKEDDYCKEEDKTQIHNGKPCQCSCNSPTPITDSPAESKFKEPLSAPF